MITSQGADAVIRMRGGIIYNELQYYQKMVEQHSSEMNEIQANIHEYNET